MSLGSLGSLVVSLTAETAQFTSAMDQAAYKSQKSMQAMMTQAVATGNLIGDAIVRSARYLFDFVEQSINAGDALAKMSTRTGLAVETLAGLKFVAETADSSLESLASSVGRMQKVMGEAEAGNKQYQSVLKALGITARDPEQALIQLADATVRLEDPNQRAAALNQILGRSYQDLLPLLTQGGQKIRELMERGRELLPVTQAEAEAAALFNDNLTELEAMLRGTGVTLAGPFVQTMNQAVQVMREAAGEVGQGSALLVGLGQLGTAGQIIGVLWSNVFYVFRMTGNEIGGIVAQLAALARMDFKGAGLIGEMMRKDAATARGELDALEKRIMGLAGATQSAIAKGASASGKQTPIVLPRNLFGGGGAGAGKGKLDVLDPFYAQRKAAMDAAARATQEANNVAFEEAESLRAYQEQAAERAAAAWGQMRDSIIRAIDPLQQYRDQLDDLDKLIEYQNEHGLVLITDEQVTEYRFRIQEMMDQAAGFGQAMNKQVDDFQKKFQENFQQGLADFLFDPFKEGLDGMVAGFGRMLQRMVADAIAADITRYLFGDSKTFGSGGTGIFSSLVDMLPKFNVGTPFVPNDMLAVVHKGEAIVPAKYNKPGGMGGTTVNVSIQANDLGSFRRSEGQISAALSRAVNAARRYQ